MQQLHFPLHFAFKILTPSNDFSVFDSRGGEIAYTRQKIFKLQEEVEIFRDTSRQERLFTITADRIIDFNACYTVRDGSGTVLGSIKRDGIRSLWKTRYTVADSDGRTRYTIREHNPWTAVLDGLLGEIPVLGLLTGYFFNPSYGVFDHRDTQCYLLEKQASFWERRFRLAQTARTSDDDDVLILNAVIMLMLLERNDG